MDYDEYMDIERWDSAVFKGLIGAFIAVMFAYLFHKFVISTSQLRWALTAVSIGSFLSGFFADITD